MSIEMWQTTDLDEAIAEEIFGWRWLAYKDTPVRGTPGYPAECRVRRFFPPKTLENKKWQEYFAEIGGYEPANGDEPLDYSYCSSFGPAMVPHFSGHRDAIDDMETELEKRGLFNEYVKHLTNQLGDDSPRKVLRADCKTKCIAALAAVGSKYVTIEEAKE